MHAFIHTRLRARFRIRTVAGTSAYGNETSGSIKCREFLD